ncbi:MAG: cell division protease FtsH [Chloroflexota bacterium]|nr:cell division protease FtsH [Chloroflexota bacterium]
MVTDPRARPPQQPPRAGQRPPVGPGYNPIRWRRFWLIFAALLLANIIISTILQGVSQPVSVTIPYNVFIAQLDAGNVVNITATGDSITGTTRKAVSVGQTKATNFATQRPVFASDNLEATLIKEKVSILAEPPNPPAPVWETLLLDFGPTLLLVFGFIYLMRRSAALTGGGAGGILGRFGQSNARLYNAEKPNATFADVAGIDEVKAELVEIVDFLKKPERYQRLGGTVPKGVLLIGAPGTGKTLLARAVAGEAGVPFFSISASEFIEAIVGVGASRVRDLFQKARAAAPAIVFIDELDAIGRARSSGLRLGGNEEQEQTLNQILTEMDGFDPHEGVIVLAATNRADVLDAALLRPGRFDRRVTVPFPDRRGRSEILRIHTRHIPLAPDVNLDEIASQTAGMVGADLRNLANEAALAGARRDGAVVTQADFTEALEKVELGSERKLSLTPMDRERIAYHESGHALLGLLLPGADPVRRVSIIPRGQALGVTVQTPVDDRFNYGEDYLRGRITGALGGRAAEQLVYGVITTGAESDLRNVTGIARQMVIRWGMSPKVGPLNYAEDGDGSRQSLTITKPYSEETAALIDEEVKRISDECLAQAVDLLTRHRDKLDALVHALLEHDTLGEDAILEVTGLTPPPTTPVAPPTATLVSPGTT